MECMACGDECAGKLKIIDPLLKPEEMTLCESCFNLWANQEYGKLTKRVKK